MKRNQNEEERKNEEKWGERRRYKEGNRKIEKL